MAKMAAAGVTSVRIDFAWESLQPRRGPMSPWHVRLADRCVNIARENGMSVLGTLLSRALEMAKLGLPNRMLGGVFGLLRGVMIAVVMTLGLTLFLTEDSTVLTRSRLVPHIAFGTRLMAPLLPSHVEKILIDRTDHLPGGPHHA